MGDSMRQGSGRIVPAILVMMGFVPAGMAHAQSVRPKVEIAPYRAIYDLSMAGGAKTSKIFDGAKGRMVVENKGDRCDGYTNRVRIVVVLESSERGDHRVETLSNSYESGDGKTMRFKTDIRRDGAREQVDGQADLGSKGVAVRLKEPKRKTLDLDGAAVFPTEHSIRLIETALAKENFLSVKIYDGTDKGENLHDTLSIVGVRIDPGNEASLEPPARIEPLKAMPRWPIRISFFKPETRDGDPYYTLIGEMFENGFIQKMQLEYKEFTLKGELKQLEMLKPNAACR